MLMVDECVPQLPADNPEFAVALDEPNPAPRLFKLSLKVKSLKYPPPACIALLPQQSYYQNDQQRAAANPKQRIFVQGHTQK